MQLCYQEISNRQKVRKLKAHLTAHGLIWTKVPASSKTKQWAAADETCHQSWSAEETGKTNNLITFAYFLTLKLSLMGWHNIFSRSSLKFQVHFFLYMDDLHVTEKTGINSGFYSFYVQTKPCCTVTGSLQCGYNTYDSYLQNKNMKKQKKKKDRLHQVNNRRTKKIWNETEWFGITWKYNKLYSIWNVPCVNSRVNSW